ncbi:FecR domain-containing protein [Aquimarina sp. 2201CG14-23]|uniref:FecR domain-containing protein n=1 Tax=Aquimarina mycalae TaxID=3040073 RepID=UPI002477F18E|nr:FecR domain-containing protein [Aquimarina sp. 2201CG14-23]MDH7444300.1 FecR domain-containing protein [Aquimarina sp. 2201CG14-23]
MKKHLQLIEEYLKNTISPEDREILKSWLEEDEEHKDIFKEKVTAWSATKEEISVDPKKAYDRFVTKIQEKDSEKAKVISLRPWRKVAQYAAVLAGILVVGYFITKTNPVYTENENTIVSTESLPEDKIKIVQEDGTVIYMDVDDQSDIVTADGTVIGTKEQDQLIVTADNKDNKVGYLEISIPKGKIFQLSLHDGTKVWLNAASTLKFPQQFNASEKNRTVYLDGEAFFDVTTNKEQPFIVQTKEIQVEVLGTQFNVSSYADDTTVRTTLVEGSVAVNDSENQSNLLKLIPSYQAIYSKDQKIINKQKVNTELFTSWMYRKMIIQDESFASIIKRLERTYDVEIVSNNQKLNDTQFTGEFDIENVRQILNVFSETINFTYKIENKRIVIAP